MSTELLGRSKELRLVSRLTVMTASGVGQAVVVEGESGIGKTALLRSAAADAHAKGMCVLMGGAEELEWRLPFAAMSSCLDATPLGEESAADAEVPRSSIAASHLVPAGEAALARIDELCAQGPLALILDDVHWADDETLLVLEELAASLHQLPLLLLVAHRSAKLRPGVERMRQRLLDSGAAWLALPALGEENVRDLLTARLGATPGAGLLQLASDAAGNPLYVTELVEALALEGAILFEDGVAETTRTSAPRSLDTMILHHLNVLPPHVLDILRLASVMGRGFTSQELALVASRTVAEITSILQQASAAKILTGSTARPAFRHPVVAQALYMSLPAPLRTALHLEAGLALASRAAEPERVAKHLALAPPSGDPRLVAWLNDHIHTLIARAPSTAVDLLQRTLECVNPREPSRDSLRLHLTHALLWSARLPEAQDQARQALAGIKDRTLEGAFRWVLVYGAYLADSPGLAVREAETALRCGALSSSEIVQFSALASAALVNIDLDRAETVAREAIESARRLHVRTPADAQGTLAVIRYQQWRTREALELVERALQAASEEDRFGDGHIQLHILRAYCLLQHSRTREAEQAIDTGRQIADRFGGAQRPLCDLAQAIVMFITGRWDDALTQIQSALQWPTSNTSSGWVAAALRSLGAVIAVRRGALTTAKAQLAEVAPQTHISPCYAFLTLWARCLSDLAEAAPERAINRFFAETRSPLGGPVMLMAPRLVCLVSGLGHPRLAQALTDDLEARAAVGPSCDLMSLALHCRGLMTSDVAALAEAASFYEQTPWMPFRASYYEDVAAALAHAGCLPQARTRLYQALDLYNSMGAAWDISRATSRLRALGVRCGYRGRRGRPSSGWDSLTDTELTVAELVAQGLSNPEVAAHLLVSRRTVQTHVSNILSKLGLTSRVELATEVIRQTISRDGTGTLDNSSSRETRLEATMLDSQAVMPHEHVPPAGTGALYAQRTGTEPGCARD